MSRKKILALLLAVGLIAVTICLERCAFSPHTTLTVCTQQDCIHPDVLEAFTEDTGIEVEYIVLENSAGLEELPDCDVLLADVEQLSAFWEQQALLELDQSQIPNAETIDNVFSSIPFIRDSGCAGPCLWTTMGLIYDPALTDTRVTGWSNLFSGDFSGRVVMPESSRESYAAALAALGLGVNTNDTEDAAAAGDYLEQQLPLILDYCSSPRLAELIATDPQLIAPCYGADAIRLMASTESISFVIPSEGTWQMVLAYAIPVETQNQELAYTLIDYLCRPESLAKNAAYSSYSTVSLEAYELLDPSWQVNPLAYPTGTDWTVYPMLDSQDSQIRTDCQVRWHQIQQDWSEHHWES